MTGPEPREVTATSEARNMETRPVEVATWVREVECDEYYHHHGPVEVATWVERARGVERDA